MDQKQLVVSNSFNGQRFDKFSTTDEATGNVNFSFAIDGVEVSTEEWAQQREAALTRFVDGKRIKRLG